MAAGPGQPARFGFVLHPIDPKRDVARRFPLLARVLSERWIHFFSAYFPPVYLGRIRGLRSAATGAEAEGVIVACPYTPQRMMQLPPQRVYRKIVATVGLAERLGAQIVGLGAYTSVVGDAGLTVSRQARIPVTTGDSYTVAVAVEALLEAARQVGAAPEAATAAVVGATGAIGSACAQLLAGQVAALVLVGRDPNRLAQAAGRLAGRRAKVTTATDLGALRQADLVLTASSAPGPIIRPEHLAPGAVVVDVARPPDVAPEVATRREDVLVLEGGLVSPPGQVTSTFDIDLPAGVTYACLAETMALALEGRLESYTVGKAIEARRVREIQRIAARHGFRLGPFRSFGRPVTPADFARVRAHRPALAPVRGGAG